MNSFNPYLEVIFAAAIWGTTGSFIKILKLPSTTLTFIRAAVPTFVIFAYLFIKKKPLFKGSRHLVFTASFLNAVRMLLYFIGFNLTSIGNAVIILYTGPIFTNLFGSFFLKEQITKKQVMLSGLAFLGIVVMYSNKPFTFGDRDFIGMSAVLVSTILYSLTVIIFKAEIQKYSKLETIFYQNILAVFIFSPFLLINKPVPTVNQWIIATIYAMLIGLIGFMLFFSALKKIPASVATLLTYVEVISAITFAVLLFHEVISINMIVGGGLIVLSTILLQRLQTVR